jgi:hypothetical protein
MSWRNEKGHGKVERPVGDLLEEGLSQGCGKVVVFRAVVNLVST